jgi:hypothetical protein
MPESVYYRGKGSRYPLNERFDGPQRKCNDSGEQRNILPLPGIKPRFLDRLTRDLAPEHAALVGGGKWQWAWSGRGGDPSAHRSISPDLNLSGQKTWRYVAAIRREEGREAISTCVSWLVYKIYPLTFLGDSSPPELRRPSEAVTDGALPLLTSSIPARLGGSASQEEEVTYVVFARKWTVGGSISMDFCFCFIVSTDFDRRIQTDGIDRYLHIQSWTFFCLLVCCLKT